LELDLAGGDHAVVAAQRITSRAGPSMTSSRPGCPETEQGQVAAALDLDRRGVQLRDVDNERLLVEGADDGAEALRRAVLSAMS